ncbi:MULTISPECIES: hypothetical protein [unclassified Pseudoclavibacter]|uniref:hypothetical protein n=1 Tax=unclassified Pseudoclavibacter TaxID=2615177 RepID=UPI00215876CD|nr:MULTISPECIES: hypothetical protein [unclassified Pseudoclavibacter]
MSLIRTPDRESLTARARAARFVLAFALIFATLVLAAMLAPFAQAAEVTAAAGAPQVAFTLDPILVGQLVLAVVLPLLVGLVTTRVTSSSTKAWLLVGLSLLTALLAEAISAWQAGGIYDIGTGLLLALPTFLIAVGMHYGIWKPTGTSTALQKVGGKHAA